MSALVPCNNLRSPKEERHKMPYIIQTRERAIEAGVDTEEEEIIYVVTAGQIAAQYNHHRNDLNSDDSPDYWTDLPEDQKNQYLLEANRVIGKLMTNWDEQVRDIFPDATT